MSDFCQCYDCEASEFPCNFDCGRGRYVCEGCMEADDAAMDAEFDAKAAQGCL